MKPGGNVRDLQEHHTFHMSPAPIPNVRPMVISFVTDTLLALPFVVNCFTACSALPAVLAMITCMTAALLVSCVAAVIKA
jgi:hypothetical protein